MTALRLSLALPAYEHALDLLSGRVVAEGIDLNWIRAPLDGIGRRLARGDFAAADLPLAEYLARRSSGDDAIVALPVFTSRLFVQGAIWVRAGGPVRTVDDLADRGLCCAGRDSTAVVYLRSWLRQALGRDPAAAPLDFAEADDAFDALGAGACDAVLSFDRPRREGKTQIRRLIADTRPAEHAYYKASGVFPILRVLCLRREVAERDPWVAASLFDGFLAAKRGSLKRLISAGMSRYPMPWINAYIVQTRAVFGDDFWPYGLKANRATLEVFLHDAQAGGLIEEPVAVESLFHPALLDS